MQSIALEYIHRRSDYCSLEKVSSFLGVLPCVYVSGNSHKPRALCCANLGRPYVLDMRLECTKLLVSAVHHSVDIDLPIRANYPIMWRKSVNSLFVWESRVLDVSVSVQNLRRSVGARSRDITGKA